jgi:hypothetical protein
MCRTLARGSKILFFLFRTRVVCSSWKVDSANYFALCAFSEVRHSPGPMRQGFYVGMGDSKLCVHTFSAELAPKPQKNF